MSAIDEINAKAKQVVDKFRAQKVKSTEWFRNNLGGDVVWIFGAIHEMEREKRTQIVGPLDKMGLTEVIFQASVNAAEEGLGNVEIFLTGGLLDWTDCSPAVCQTLIKGGKAIPFHLNKLKSVEIPKGRKAIEAIDEPNNEGVQKWWPAYNSLSMLHNISKLSESWPYFQELNVSDVLKTFLTYPKDQVQMLALCTTAWILSDSQQSASLADDCNIIPKLVKNLQLALEDEKEHLHIFYAEELAQSLAHLAVNDNNKKAIANTGVIETLVSMLAGSNELEQVRAVDCLWALSFDDSIREDIKREEGFEKAMTNIVNKAKNVQLKKKASVAHDFIKVGRQGMAETGRPKSVKPKSKDADEEGHIFISYNWEHQEIVLKIRQFLLDKGFKVWMDVDNMTNNTLEAMASGVEQAKLILICYSEHYKQSNMCRTEAEYVFRLGKPFIPINLEYRYFPTGWLGIIIGARLYVDFSLHKHPLDVVFGRLDNELKTLLNKLEADDLNRTKALAQPSKKEQPAKAKNEGSNAKNSTKEDPVYHICPQCDIEMLVIPAESTSHPFFPKKDVGKAISKWKEKDVTKWVQSEGFSKGVLANFDGNALISFFHMKQSVCPRFSFICPCLICFFSSKAPDTFYNSVMEMVGKSLPQSMKLTAAIEKIVVQ